MFLRIHFNQVRAQVVSERLRQKGKLFLLQQIGVNNIDQLGVGPEAEHRDQRVYRQAN